MAIKRATAKTMIRGQQKAAMNRVVPAPIGGIDVSRGLAFGNELNSLYSYNLVAAEYGLRVRPGYREWAINLDNGSYLGTHTIIPFGGDDVDLANDRLFAVTNEGIWDVTAEANPPVLVLDFTAPGNGLDISADAGYGVYTNYTLQSGERVLFYADQRNGLFRYTESTDTWAREAFITGPVIENVNFVMQHKNQIWMIERDSSSAWYLEELAVAGAATQFFFGTKFRHGGYLAGLFTWTIDGGAGVDDYFVAVSRAGDTIVYQGNDPSSADDWSMTGQWFIGEIPKGQKFGSQHGGNLYLLSVQGLMSMDEIIRGVDGKNDRADIASRKIAYYIRPFLQEYKNENGWELRLTPSIGQLIVNAPPRVDGVEIQWVKNTTMDSWGLWRTVPMFCVDEWRGEVYLGDGQGRVLIMDNFVDNELITPPPVGINGQAIPFSVLTSFSTYDSPTLFKRGKYIRPQFLATSAPSVTTAFRYDYDLLEELNTTPAPTPTGSIWDGLEALWNLTEWDNSVPEGYADVKGGWSMGRTVAIVMTGRSIADTTFISWDVVYDVGAPL